jgi:glycosyltransferase involved in cell wall biosynthesis
MEFPKILIIGQSFNKKSGGGVTISNLFPGWPKDRLAVASNTNLSADMDSSVCTMYYQLGYGNKLHPFPLNIILPEIKCGPITVTGNENKTSAAAATVKTGNYKSLYKILNAVLHFTGLYHFFYKLKITPEFKQWLQDYQPDIIYTQLASLELIKFTDDVHELTKKPVAIHIMDDWPLTIDKPGILYFYWKKVIDRSFRQLLDKSSIFMSICEEMSEEYKLRYNKTFIPFHNPIDIGNWLPFAKNNWIIKDKFVVLYAGRIGTGVFNSITEIAAAVNELAATGYQIEFQIQTGDAEALKKLIQLNEHIKWIKPMSYAALPERFASVDLLVIPQDFDTESIKFLKYSFPTKISEYMVTATPVLVYAPDATALTKYASKYGWGYVVNTNDKEKLVKAIGELYNNEDLRRTLAQTAQKLAIEREDAVIVKENFRKSFILNNV